MADAEQAKKNWVCWVNYGYEGWKPYGYNTLKEAVQHEAYGSERVITPGAQDYEVFPQPQAAPNN